MAPPGSPLSNSYDDSTGQLDRLLGNLVGFSPLYGAPALLIRELARTE